MHLQIIPKDFESRYRTLLGEDFDNFLKISSSKLKKTIRVNTIKCKSLGKGYTQHPTIPFAYYTDKNILSDSIEYKSGMIHPQEISSMIPPLVLDPKPNETILDMTAAPGSKTTQIAAMMNNTGSIISIDNSLQRLKGLRYNINRLGVVNTTIIKNDSTMINLGIKFDRILLDAPCSSEGLIRKKLSFLNKWSIANINEKSRLQKELILNSFDHLKKGGILVYSTCTLAPEENEGVIDYLLNNRKDASISNISIKGIKTRSGITTWNKEIFSKDIQKTIRIYPQDNDTEAFFIARVKKT